MNRITLSQSIVRFVRFAILTTLAISITNPAGSNAFAAEPQLDPILVVACEIEEASEAMRDELKTHFRHVRRYGLMVGTNSLIKGRAKAIERRFKRDPNYRGLDRDVARVGELANRLAELIQEAISCPEQCSRIEGNYQCVVGRVNQLLSLSESLRIAAAPYCVVVDQVVPGLGAEPGYQPYGGAYSYDLSQGTVGENRTYGPFSGPLEAARPSRGLRFDPSIAQPRFRQSFEQPLPPGQEFAPGIIDDSERAIERTPFSRQSTGPFAQPRSFEYGPVQQPSWSNETQRTTPQPSLRPTIEPAQPVLIGPQPSMRSVLEPGTTGAGR